MFTSFKERLSYTAGFFVSLIAHVLCAAIALLMLENAKSAIPEKAEIFSVTLEGGERLGGYNQAPKDDKKVKALPNVEATTDQKVEEVEREQKTEKKLETPSVVEDPVKLQQEKEKKEAQEKKLAEMKKLEEQKEKERELAEEKKKREAEEKKKQAEDDKKKALDEKAQKEKEKKERDKRLAAAIRNAAKKYEGESANAGGEGFGAAALGGKGMGGGKLESLEFIAYRNELERHIKAGWRWLPGSKRLVTQIQVYISEDGTVQHVNIVASSGNSAFDESVRSTVIRSSPVPRPPPHLYDRFREVRITFDSEN